MFHYLYTLSFPLINFWKKMSSNNNNNKDNNSKKPNTQVKYFCWWKQSKEKNEWKEKMMEWLEEFWVW